jgi:hypothetical protein
MITFLQFLNEKQKIAKFSMKPANPSKPVYRGLGLQKVFGYDKRISGVVGK